MSAQRIQQLRDRNEKVWTEFYNEYADALLVYFASRKLFGNASSSDLVQETFLKAFRGIGRFRPEDYEKIGRWLFSIAKNCRKDMLRSEGRALARNERYGRELENWIQNPSDIEDITDYRDLRDDVRAALEGLPRRQRTVVFLRYCCGLSAKEVAEAMGISVGTVNGQTHKGNKLLKEKLAGEAHSRNPDGKRESRGNSEA